MFLSFSVLLLFFCFFSESFSESCSISTQTEIQEPFNYQEVDNLNLKEKIKIPGFDKFDLQKVYGDGFHNTHVLVEFPQTMIRLSYHRNKSISQIDFFFSDKSHCLGEWKHIGSCSAPYIRIYKAARHCISQEMECGVSSYDFKALTLEGGRSLFGHRVTPDKVLRFYPNGQLVTDTTIGLLGWRVSLGKRGDLLWKMGLNPILDDKARWHSLEFDRFGNIQTDISVVRVNGKEMFLVEKYGLSDGEELSHLSEAKIFSKELVEKETGASFGVQKFKDGKLVETILSNFGS